MIKVLIGCPIYQKPNILKEFLISLKELEIDNLEVNYMFINDNVNQESSKILYEFKEEMDKNNENERVKIIKSNFRFLYICDKNTHRWNNTLIKKVSLFKNLIIEEGKKEEVDYLFLIDSDLVLNKRTLKRLIEDRKDIVSNIFWTKWSIDEEALPQVWIKDDYTLYDLDNGEILDERDKEVKEKEFIENLKIKGLYKVGGVSGAILISKEVLLKGVNFNKIYNLSYLREDRHFSIRAVALGFDLYVDTYYPALHLYREEDLKRALIEYKIENR